MGTILFALAWWKMGGIRGCLTMISTVDMEKGRVMSDDLIKRSDAIKKIAKKLEWELEVDMDDKVAEWLNTISAVEPKQGKWIVSVPAPAEVRIRCSICNRDSYSRYDYCQKRSKNSQFLCCVNGFYNVL